MADYRPLWLEGQEIKVVEGSKYLLLREKKEPKGCEIEWKMTLFKAGFFEGWAHVNLDLERRADVAVTKQM